MSSAKQAESLAPTLFEWSPSRPLANVLGVGVDAIDTPRSAATIEKAVQTGCKGYVCVTGVHGVMEAHRNPSFRRILSRALLVAPDGMPTVWVGKWQGHRGMQRVFGPDLMFEICRRSEETGITHYLYGGKPGVGKQLQSNLRRWFPAIRVVGTYTPPFRPLSQRERSELRKKVARLSPDIMWVGLSTPKQELFMAEYLGELDCRVMIGVGAAFDIHSGHLKDAPLWVKNAGLQWLHRLMQEPTRLWKRYLINNSTFLLNILLQETGMKRYPLSTTSLPLNENISSPALSNSSVTQNS